MEIPVPISAEIEAISTEISRQKVISVEISVNPTEILQISAEIPIQKENLGRDFCQSCPRFAEIRPCGFHLTRAAPKSWRAVPKEPPKVRLKLLPHQGKLSNKYGVTHKTIPYYPQMLGRARIFQQDMKRVLKKKIYGSCEEGLKGLDEQSKVFDVS